MNIDGGLLREIDRLDDWQLDLRVPVGVQAGEELYVGNDLDRGHLVRRRDPVWGEPGVAARANVDTFVYPNAARQAAEFNQSELLKYGLEDYVLEHARMHRRRLSVLTGPVLADDDPVYRGVQLPRRFWKVAAWAAEVSGDDQRPPSSSTTPSWRWRRRATCWIRARSFRASRSSRCEPRSWPRLELTRSGGHPDLGRSAEEGVLVGRPSNTRRSCGSKRWSWCEGQPFQDRR